MTKKEASPAFQFYPKDWLSCPDVMMMTPAQEGAYIRLMCFDWQNDGIVNNESAISQLARIPFDQLEIVLGKFKVHPKKTDHISHPRLQKERKKQKQNRKKKSISGKAGAQKRWGDRPKSSGKQGVTEDLKNSGCHSDAMLLPLANDSPSPSPSPSPSSSTAKDKGTAQRLADIFIELCPSLPKPDKIDPGRKKLLMARFKSIESDFDRWKKICRSIEASDFLAGRTENAFSCGIDWVIAKKNFTKIQEGNYEANRNGISGSNRQSGGSGKYAGYTTATSNEDYSKAVQGG